MRVIFVQGRQATFVTGRARGLGGEHILDTVKYMYDDGMELASAPEVSDHGRC